MKQLGQLETVVMDRLWAWGRPCAVREVLEDLQRERSIAYTTVMTVMDNLQRKGLLKRVLDGRAYRYEPVQTREEHTATLMGQVLDGSGDRTATLLRFVEQMPAAEAARLREALAEATPPRKRSAR